MHRPLPLFTLIITTMGCLAVPSVDAQATAEPQVVKPALSKTSADSRVVEPEARPMAEEQAEIAKLNPHPYVLSGWNLSWDQAKSSYYEYNVPVPVRTAPNLIEEVYVSRAGELVLDRNDGSPRTILGTGYYNVGHPAVVWARGLLVVAAVKNDHTVATRTRSDSYWYDEVNLGGWLSGDLAIVSTGWKFTVFGTGQDSQLWSNTGYGGGMWSTNWQSLGGEELWGGPTAAAMNANRIDVVAMGRFRMRWLTLQNGVPSWQDIPQLASAVQPNLVSLHDGELQLIYESAHAGGSLEGELSTELVGGSWQPAVVFRECPLQGETRATANAELGTIDVNALQYGSVEHTFYGAGFSWNPQYLCPSR
jgi:hypothetical protein